jgi:hypothetical protein
MRRDKVALIPPLQLPSSDASNAANLPATERLTCPPKGGRFAGWKHRPASCYQDDCTQPGAQSRENVRVKKVFHFDAPRDKYHCDAAIVWCFDNRFQLGFSKYLKRLGIINSDPIKVAGGAKCLASPEQENDREFVLEQIRKSIRLHGTKLVILMLHSDCGAYGGLAGGFGNNASLEAQHHEQELKRAAECVRGRIPGIDVQAYFVDFEGIWAVELQS